MKNILGVILMTAYLVIIGWAANSAANKIDEQGEQYETLQ